MIPIHQLLSRIRFDRDFAQGEFVIGYQDRFSPDIIRVPLKEVVESPGGGQALELLNSAGELVSIPMHRIVEVQRDGVVIWERAR